MTSKPIMLTCLVAALAAVGIAGWFAFRPADGPPPIPPEGLDGFVTIERLPMPKDPELIKGRAVWGGTCQGCHGIGAAGSPKITNRLKWASRIAKGMDALTEHAIQGFFGPTGTQMPPKGGNPKLTDDQVRAAVRFMVTNSR